MPELPTLNRPLTDKPENSYTLSADYYLSEDVFELEKQRIFYRSWQYVAPLAHLAEAGAYATLRICDENIFVIRSDDGQLRAFYNVCRHRAHELLAGSGKLNKLIVCPYHAWSYSNRGDLVRAPMSEHRVDFDPSDFCLREVRVEVFCSFVFVNLDPDCESLQTLAGDLEEDMRAHLPYFDELKPTQGQEQGDTRIEAGWKVIVDNYVECYHCRGAHPDFASVIDMDTYQLEVHALWSRQYGARIRTDNSAYPLPPGNNYQQSVFWFLWPNMTFNVLPGPPTLGAYAIRPLGVACSEFSGYSMTANGEVYQARADYINDTLNPEDIGICESVQRGLRSTSYDQGAYMTDPDRSGEGEQALHQFHRLVHSALAND